MPNFCKYSQSASNTSMDFSYYFNLREREAAMTKWIIGTMLLSAAQAGAVDFYAHWADGKAEVSSYEVVQPRYGELPLHMFESGI